MTKKDVVNKFKTLTQGKISDSVLGKMAMTFTNLVKYADFEAGDTGSEGSPKPDELDGSGAPEKLQSGTFSEIGGLIYNIQLVLPESRDPSVYDALFESLRKHLS